MNPSDSAASTLGRVALAAIARLRPGQKEVQATTRSASKKKQHQEAVPKALSVPPAADKTTSASTPSAPANPPPHNPEFHSSALNLDAIERDAVREPSPPRPLSVARSAAGSRNSFRAPPKETGARPKVVTNRAPSATLKKQTERPASEVAKPLKSSLKTPATNATSQLTARDPGFRPISVPLREQQPHSRGSSRASSSHHSQTGKPESRPASRISQQSRASRASAQSTQSEIYPEGPQDLGLAHILHPVLAGSRMNAAMNAGTRTYPRSQFENVRTQIKHVSDPAYIRENLFADLERNEHVDEILDDNEEFDIPTLQGPGATSQVLISLGKHLRTIAPRNLGYHSPTIRHFLNSFILQSTIHRLNEAQCERILPEYFEGELQDLVKRRLRFGGLQAVLDELRLSMCPPQTKSQCKRALDTFKIDATQPLVSLLQIQDLMMRIDPDMTRDRLEDQSRCRFMIAAPEPLTSASRKKEGEYLERFYGQPYTFHRWQRDIGRLGNNLAKHATKTIHEEPRSVSEEPLTVSKLEECLQTFAIQKPSPTESAMGQLAALKQTADQFYEEGKRVAHEENKRVANLNYSSPPSNNAPKPSNKAKTPKVGQTTQKRGRGEPPQPISAAQFQEACDKWKRVHLISNPEDYPCEGHDILDYRVDGKVFKPGVPIMKSPTKNPFGVFPDGNIVIHHALSNHYRGRCSSCGMLGHTANHPGCIYALQPPTWTMCDRCETGFHNPAKCALDKKLIVPHRYPRQTRPN